MPDVVIQTTGLGKMYHIGGDRERYRTLRGSLVKAVKRPIERIRHPGAVTHRSEPLWALRGVDLEIRRGDVLGIIGRNGTGKSTLLKVLSRITQPTEGRVEMRGRVGSLLEVGTGFHSELTGRENIVLNGAILGMSRSEIRRKYDEIVEFSEMERFLDTPVKRYSSGMYVRLAFAVAAHLEPEILLVDEVLAVGDAGFQKKCLGKMEDMAGGGRTVLFVSHNMATILSLCSRAVLLEGGHIVMDAVPTEVVRHYQMIGAGDVNRFLPTAPHARRGDGRVRIDDFRIDPLPLQTGQRAEFEFRLSRTKSNGAPVRFELAVGVFTEYGIPIMSLSSRDMGRSFEVDGAASVVVVSVPSLPLAPGRYRLNLWLGAGAQPIDWLHDCMTMEVGPGQLTEKAYVHEGGYPVVVATQWTLAH